MYNISISVIYIEIGWWTHRGFILTCTVYVRFDFFFCAHSPSIPFVRTSTWELKSFWCTAWKMYTCLANARNFKILLDFYRTSFFSSQMYLIAFVFPHFSWNVIHLFGPVRDDHVPQHFHYKAIISKSIVVISPFFPSFKNDVWRFAKQKKNSNILENFMHWMSM